MRLSMPSLSLCPDNLQLLRNMHKVIRIILGHEFSLVGFLDIVLIALFVGEIDSVLLAVELDTLALHEIGAGLPAHERVLPAVAFGEGVPIH